MRIVVLTAGALHRPSPFVHKVPIPVVLVLRRSKKSKADKKLVANLKVTSASFREMLLGDHGVSALEKSSGLKQSPAKQPPPADSDERQGEPTEEAGHAGHAIRRLKKRSSGQKPPLAGNVAGRQTVSQSRVHADQVLRQVLPENLHDWMRGRNSTSSRAFDTSSRPSHLPDRLEPPYVPLYQPPGTEADPPNASQIGNSTGSIDPAESSSGATKPPAKMPKGIDLGPSDAFLYVSEEEPLSKVIPVLLDNLLEAVRDKNSVRVVRIVHLLRRYPNHYPRLQDVLVTIKPNVFSEILRMLDPFILLRQVDIAGDARIRGGLFTRSPVGLLNTVHGVRWLYHSLFRPMFLAVRRRLVEDLSVSLADYLVLIRMAGASQDITAVQEVWGLMEQVGHHSWRNIHAYDEFTAARFLTHPLYYQFDKARVRVRLENLHRSTTFLSSRALLQLRRRRTHINFRRINEYGRRPEVEGEPQDLSRVLRARRPIMRIERGMGSWGIRLSEKTACNLIVAYARSGARRTVRSLLSKWFGIRITERRREPARVAFDSRARFSLLKPTTDKTLLMHTLTEAFGALGDAKLAQYIVSALSARFLVAIPAEVWSALLEWAYVIQSYPVAQERAVAKSEIADWRAPRLGAEDVCFIYHTMTSPPYSVQPTPADRDVFVKALIATGDLGGALDEMLHERAQYDALLDENIEAACTLHAYERVLPPGSALLDQLSINRQRSRFSLGLAKNHIRQWLVAWLRKCSETRLAREANVAVLVPQMLHTFRGFTNDPIKYRTPGGTVRLYLRDEKPGGEEAAMGTQESVFAGTEDELERGLGLGGEKTRRSPPPFFDMSMSEDRRYAAFRSEGTARAEGAEDGETVPSSRQKLKSKLSNRVKLPPRLFKSKIVTRTSSGSEQRIVAPGRRHVPGQGRKISIMFGGHVQTLKFRVSDALTRTRYRAGRNWDWELEMEGLEGLEGQEGHGGQERLEPGEARDQGLGGA